MSTTTPTDARTVELYQVQGGVAAPLQVRCTCEKPDATDIEALIAAAIVAHNKDPNAHPDIRKAIEDAAGNGGGLVTTPVLTLDEKLPIGAVATLGMTATAGLNGAHVQSFSVTIGDAEPVIVEAADNAAEYTFTPNGNAGDMVSVSVVATDNFGNRSPAASTKSELYEKQTPIYIASSRGTTETKIKRSIDYGVSFLDFKEPPVKTISGMCQTGDGGLLVAGESSETSTFHVYKTTDDGASWRIVFDLPYAPDLMKRLSNNHIFIAQSYIVYISDNDGETFTQYSSGITTSSIGEAQGGVLYAASRFTTYNRPRRSSDGGKSWEYLTYSGGTIKFLTASQKTGNICLFTDKGVPVRSTDGGQNWTASNAISSDVYEYIAACETANGDVILSGFTNTSTKQGVFYKGTASFATWGNRLNLGTEQYYALAAYPNGVIIGGGSKGNIRRSTNNGVSWEAAKASGLTNCSYIA